MKMITQRNIALCIVLYIVTCGLYGLYWYVCITDEMNHATDDQGTTGVMALLFTLITCGLYGFYWAYKMGEKVDAVKAKNGEPASNSGILYIILTLFGLGVVAWAIIQNELNKVAEA